MKEVSHTSCLSNIFVLICTHLQRHPMDKHPLPPTHTKHPPTHKPPNKYNNKERKPYKAWSRRCDIAVQAASTKYSLCLASRKQFTLIQTKQWLLLISKLPIARRCSPYLTGHNFLLSKENPYLLSPAKLHSQNLACSQILENNY